MNPYNVAGTVQKVQRLDRVWSGDRIPVGEIFYTPIQTGPGAHPNSCTTDTGSFLGVKRPGRGINHQPPSSTEVKERVELYLYSLAGPSWPVLGTTLPLSLYLLIPYGRFE
jgi:hypothetical protein